MHALNDFLRLWIASWPLAFADAGPFASHTLSYSLVHPLIQQIILSSYYMPEMVQDADVLAINKIQSFWPLGVYITVVRDTA